MKYQKVDSRYTLVVQVAREPDNLYGQKPLISVDSHKPVTVAIHEVNHGKVRYRKKKKV